MYVCYLKPPSMQQLSTLEPVLHEVTSTVVDRLSLIGSGGTSSVEYHAGATYYNP